MGGRADRLPDEPEYGSARQRAARWAGTAEPLWLARWAVLSFLAVDGVWALLTDPPGAVPVATGVVVVLGVAVANVGLRVASLRDPRPERLRRLAGWSVVLDVVLVTAFVWIHAVDHLTGHVLLYFFVVAGAAWTFGLAGALTTWIGAALLTGASMWLAGAPAGTRSEPRLVVSYVVALLIVAFAAGLLSERVSEREVRVAEALAERDEELRWRRGLIDMLAHDLRSPVATASTSAELLATRARELEPEQLADLAEATRRQLRRGLRLLDDLLDLGRARTGGLTLHPESVDLAELARSTVAELPDRLVGSADVRVESDGPVVANVDPARLSQVLWNLMTNAAKHGVPPITVRIRIEGDEALIDVADRGPGVDPTVSGSLFEPFVTTGDHGSTGLGLWISRLLVDAQGGALTYDHRDGETRFEVRFPIVS
ncbi:MAG: HAMP domain-containing sensor histidine kinase [Nitriliruptoraceae bacterium]